jgi:hypothetical protein
MRFFRSVYTLPVKPAQGNTERQPHTTRLSFGGYIVAWGGSPQLDREILLIFISLLAYFMFEFGP